MSHLGPGVLTVEPVFLKENMVHHCTHMAPDLQFDLQTLFYNGFIGVLNTLVVYGFTISRLKMCLPGCSPIISQGASIVVKPRNGPVS